MSAGTFVTELFAFVLKEVLVEAESEEPVYSFVPTLRLEHEPEVRNQFGEHCLEIVGQFRSSLSLDRPVLVGDDGASAALQAVGSVVWTGFVVERVWSALRNEIVDSRHGVSLSPKVGSRKAVLALTLRW